MLILRHKKKKASTNTSTVENGEHNAAVYRGETSSSTITAHSAVEDEKQIFHHACEPQTYQPGNGNEMAMAANVWELDGRERPAPVISELEAPSDTHPNNEPIPACLRVGYKP